MQAIRIEEIDSDGLMRMDESQLIRLQVFPPYPAIPNTIFLKSSSQPLSDVSLLFISGYL
jgi:hypothetical protein